MGLCASQARLLMLTSRKADLTFRRMQISNAKQMLAMKEEEIATKYADALANRQYTTMIDGKETPLNGKNLYQAFDDLNLAFDCDYGSLKSRFGVDKYEDLDETQLYEAFSLGILTAMEPEIDDSTGQPSGYNELDLGSYSNIKDGYYTKDDGAAEAEYTGVRLQP